MVRALTPPLGVLQPHPCHRLETLHWLGLAAERGHSHASPRANVPYSQSWGCSHVEHCVQTMAILYNKELWFLASFTRVVRSRQEA